MLFIFAIAGMSFRPLARIISRGVLAVLTLCGTLQGPSQNITSTNIINLNTSLVEGKYNYHSSENFDAYLKELGVSWYLRDLAAIAAPVVSISRLNNSQCSRSHVQNNGSRNMIQSTNKTKCSTRWKIHTATFVTSHEISFALNETVTDTTMDGRAIEMVVIPTKTNQWKETQTNLNGGKTTTLIRTFFQDKMFIEMFVGNVNSSSTFVRQRT